MVQPRNGNSVERPIETSPAQAPAYRYSCPAARLRKGNPGIGADEITGKLARTFHHYDDVHRAAYKKFYDRPPAAPLSPSTRRPARRDESRSVMPVPGRSGTFPGHRRTARVSPGANCTRHTSRRFCFHVHFFQGDPDCVPRAKPPPRRSSFTSLFTLRAEERNLPERLDQIEMA